MQGRLESLNDTLKIPKYRFTQAKRRKAFKRQIQLWILYARVPKFVDPVKVHFKWMEKDKRRDYDNIMAGSKLILDALVKQERIVNDSQRWLMPPTHSFEVDKTNPRIEVTITSEPTPPSPVISSAAPETPEASK